MGDAGGTGWLLDLIEEHPGPLAFDLRSRFGLSIHDLGESVAPDESVWLVSELLTDPTAHITAAVLDWEYPVSHEWVVLASLFDLTAALAPHKRGQRAPTWPRPWRAANRVGKTSLPPEEAKRVLARLAGREALTDGR